MGIPIVIIPIDSDSCAPSPEVVLSCAASALHLFPYLDRQDRWNLWKILCTLLEKIDSGQDPPPWSEGEIDSLVAALSAFREVGMCHTLPKWLHTATAKEQSRTDNFLEDNWF